jgi:signal recognition particle subunit SRP54
MFENLQDRLERSFKNLKGQGSITEINIAATVKDIRRALVDADVNYKIARSSPTASRTRPWARTCSRPYRPGS